jgi:hypothetical protein
VVKLRDGLMTDIFGDDEPEQEIKIIENKSMDNMDLPDEIGSYKSINREPEQEAMEILEEIFEPDEY